MWLLVAAAALVGLSLGASWQAVATGIPGFALLLLLPPRRVGPRAVGAIAVSGLAAAALVVGYVLWRASTGPAMSWGGADTLRRAVDLFTMKDFSLGTDPLSGAGRGPSALFLHLGRSVVMLVREFGPLTLLAPLGALAAWRRRDEVGFWALATLLVGNIVGVALFVRMKATLGASADVVLTLGGFLLVAKIVVAVLIGLGVTWLLERTSATAVLSGALVLLVGALALNARPANHRVPDFAGAYAANVLDGLPQHAVLFTYGIEPSFALDYAQIVRHERPDVTVYRIAQLRRGWYREEMRLPALDTGTITGRGVGDADYAETVRLARQLMAQGRPVYVDLSAAYAGKTQLEPLGLQHQGLVALARGGGEPVSLGVAQTEAALARYDEAGITGPAAHRYPANRFLDPYAVAHAELGLAYQQRGQLRPAAAQFARALAIDPTDELALRGAAELARRGIPVPTSG